MNWAKIKSTFIILLLVCNIVLFSVYLEGERENKKTISSEKALVEEMIEKMEGQGIRLNGIEAPKISDLYVLRVSDKERDFSAEKKKYESMGLRSISGLRAAKDLECYLYTYDSDSTIDILYYGDLKRIRESSYEEALETAKKFASAYIKDAKYKFYRSVKQNDGSYDFYFEQVFKDVRVLDGYMFIKVKGDKVIHLKQKLVEPIEDRSRVQKLIPFSLALYRLYGSIENEGETVNIVEMSIVQELIKGEGKNKLISGEPFVYYRFMTDEGETYLIDAMENVGEK